MSERSLGHYRILRPLGQGGMGTVYLAEDTRLKRQVALKLLPETLTHDGERRMMLVREARAAASLRHPYIATIYDVDERDGATFIAMEYVPGQTLRQVLSGGAFSQERAREVAAQVAEALAAAHAAGVIHRDLKPENILIDERGTPKVIDFGLARTVVDTSTKSETSDATVLRTTSGSMAGTAAYMSPEQARGESLDARTDIFSLGCVIYEMLSGKAPFSRKSMAETLSAILTETPPALPGDLGAVLARAMQKSKDERFGSMNEFAAALRQPGTRSVSRRRLWIAAALLPVAIGGGLILSRRTSGTDDAVAGKAALGASGRPAIAVIQFEDRTNSQEIHWLAQGLPDMLVTNLAQTPGLDVISRDRVQQILQQLGKGQLEQIDATLATDLARRAGAGAIVRGSIYKSGDEIRVDVKVENVADGRVISAASSRGKDVFALIDAVSDRVRSSLTIATHSEVPRTAVLTSFSPEAYRHYLEGKSFLLNSRAAEALQAYEAALALDPEFILAKLGAMQASFTLSNYAVGQRYQAEITAKIDRLPERDRIRFEAQRAVAAEGDATRAVQLLERLIARFPDEEEAYRDLGILYARSLRDQATAVTVYDRGVKANPRSGMLHNQRAYTLAGAGRYLDAVADLEEYARLAPGEPNALDSLGEIYLMANQPDKALVNYAKVLELAPQLTSARYGRAWAYGMLGQFDQAMGEVDAIKIDGAGGVFNQRGATLFRVLILVRTGRLREADALIEKESDPEQRGNLISALAYITADPQRLKASAHWYAEALAVIKDPGVRNIVELASCLAEGIVYLNAQQLSRARESLARAKQLLHEADDQERQVVFSLEGEIALAANDPRAAEQAFRRAQPERKMFFSLSLAPVAALFNLTRLRGGLAVALAAQGEYAEAISEYEKLNKPDIANRYTSMLDPIFVLEIARLKTKLGDRDGARTDYQRFLQLWKDADPDRPELKEARQAVQ